MTGRMRQELWRHPPPQHHSTRRKFYSQQEQGDFHLPRHGTANKKLSQFSQGASRTHDTYLPPMGFPLRTAPNSSFMKVPPICSLKLPADSAAAGSA